jgi:hypothetical protein
MTTPKKFDFGRANRLIWAPECKLSTTRRAVLAAIVRSAHGDVARIGVRWIASLTGLHKCTVELHLHDIASDPDLPFQLVELPRTRRQQPRAVRIVLPPRVLSTRTRVVSNEPGHESSADPAPVSYEPGHSCPMSPDTRVRVARTTSALSPEGGAPQGECSPREREGRVRAPDSRFSAAGAAPPSPQRQSQKQTQSQSQSRTPSRKRVPKIQPGPAVETPAFKYFVAADGTVTGGPVG